MKYYLLIWFAKLFFPKYWILPTSLIYAQSKLETGNFTSNIFKLNKNLFGMKESKSTPNGFIEYGTKRGHAAYYNYFDSARDYFERQSYFKIIYKDKNQYINDTQKSGYAEDTRYIQKWKGVYDNLSFIYRYFTYLLMPTFIIGLLYIAQKTNNFQSFKSLF